MQIVIDIDAGGNVNPERMRVNLDAHDALLVSEGVMFEL